MNIDKPVNKIKIAIFLPTYKRPEYTVQCIKALEEAQEYKNTSFYLVDDGSNDGTDEILKNAKLPNKTVIVYPENVGLRFNTIKFFDWAREEKVDIIGVVGNDALMPKNWLNGMLDALLNTDLDVASLNHLPSNPAFRQGQNDTEGKGYRKADNLVGLWFMDRRLTDDLVFEHSSLSGIRGSEIILRQIKIGKEPNIGWVTSMTALDLGHWSGKAEGHIKSKAHRRYSNEIGRPVSW